MAKTTNVFARVEPEVKEQAESVLNQLGIPMSSAINVFLKQVVIQQGLPFDVKLKSKKPISLESISKEELYKALDIGIAQMNDGNTHSNKHVLNQLERQFNNE